jgi:hypothetical protein
MNLIVLSQQKDKEKEKKDENQLAKSVKDRCVVNFLNLGSDIIDNQTF